MATVDIVIVATAARTSCDKCPHMLDSGERARSAGRVWERWHCEVAVQIQQISGLNLVTKGMRSVMHIDLSSVVL